MGNRDVPNDNNNNSAVDLCNIWAAQETMMYELWNKTKKELEQIGFASEKKLEEEQFMRAEWVGTKRYAMGHWAFSHPSARPCDTTLAEFNYNYPRHPAGVAAPKRGMAPKQNFT